MALLVSALALNAFVLMGPAVSPVRTTGAVMIADDAKAKAAWLAKQNAPSFGPKDAAKTRDAAPPAGAAGAAVRYAAPPGKAYGQPQIAGLTVAQIYKKQAKAKKEYEGKAVERCEDRTGKGWDTKSRYWPIGTPHL
jgi:hypothetical protein